LFLGETTEGEERTDSEASESVSFSEEADGSLIYLSTFKKGRKRR
jgi:hypothetical protein